MKLCPLLLIVMVGCVPGPPRPASIDTAHDACENCRMIVSDVRLAAQVVAPGEEPHFFDDIGCLHDYLLAHVLPDDAVVFVAEHRTGAWIEGRRAVYTRTTDASTPMGSRIIAHATIASRDADPLAAAGAAVPASSILVTTSRAGVGE